LSALDKRATREIALGLAYAEAGQLERAVLTLVRAAEQYPDQPYAYVALGRVWLEIAQSRRDRVALSKALEALETAAERDESSEALTLLGRALLQTSDTARAERVLQAATARQPVDRSAFLYLAEASERLGHALTARTALLDYIALRGDESDGRRRVAEATRLADLSLRAHEPAAAAVFFLRAADEMPADAALLARAADAQLRAGDRDTARGTVARALERDPNNALALTVLRRAGR
jgi:tetratricopeptide (TPR) repeat protein